MWQGSGASNAEKGKEGREKWREGWGERTGEGVRGKGRGKGKRKGGVAPFRIHRSASPLCNDRPDGNGITK